MTDFWEQVPFTGDPSARGADVWSWLEQAAASILDPLIEHLHELHGPPYRYAPHEMFRPGTWTMGLTTSTPRGHYTFYEYTPSKMEKVSKKVKEGRLATVSLDVDLIPPWTDHAPAFVGTSVGVWFSSGHLPQELRVNVPKVWIPSPIAPGAIEQVLKSARSLAARPPSAQPPVSATTAPERPSTTDRPHGFTVVDTGNYSGVDVPFLLTTTTPLSADDLKRLESVVDEWHAEWVARSESPVHDTSGIETDLDDEGPGAAWSVDFGSAGDEALRDLVERVRMVAADLPAVGLRVGFPDG